MLPTNGKTLLTSRVTLENEIRGTVKALGLKAGPIAVKTFEARRGVRALPDGGRDGPNPKLLCGERLATDRIRASGHQHPV
jgi:hypothetical protein